LDVDLFEIVIYLVLNEFIFKKRKKITFFTTNNHRKRISIFFFIFKKVKNPSRNYFFSF